MHRIRWVTLAIFMSMLVFAGTQLQATTTSPPTITLEKSVYFVGPSGDPVVVEPGTYEIEAAEEWLRLIPTGRERVHAVLLHANILHVDPSLKTAKAESHQVGADGHLLTLVLSDGTVLEAEGSYSGVRSRGGRLNLLQRSKNPGNPTVAQPKLPVRPPIQQPSTQNPLPSSGATSPPPASISTTAPTTAAPSIRGDMGNDQFTLFGQGEKILVFRVEETDTNPFGPKPLSLGIDLSMSPGIDYDLEAFSNGCDNPATKQVSKRSGNINEQITMRWDDRVGEDSSRNICIRIVLHSASASTDGNWAIQVFGNINP